MEQKRARTILQDLDGVSEWWRVIPYSERAGLVLFKTPRAGRPSLMLSVARDRNLDVVYCESSIFEHAGQSVGTYPGMPDVLFSKDEAIAEIYRFYFLVYCLPKVAAFSRLFPIARKKKRLSLQTLSMACLSTSDLSEMRQRFCMAWA